MNRFPPLRLQSIMIPNLIGDARFESSRHSQTSIFHIAKKHTYDHSKSIVKVIKEYRR